MVQVRKCTEGGTMRGVLYASLPFSLSLSLPLMLGAHGPLFGALPKTNMPYFQHEGYLHFHTKWA